MSDIKIIDKILNEANQRAEQEKGATADKVSKIIEKATKKSDDIIKNAESHAKEEAVERKRRVKSVYDLEFKKDVLTMKREVLDTAFEKAVDDFAAMDDEKYKEVMQKLLVSCVSEKKGSIIVADSDKNRLDKTFIDAANKELDGGEVELASETCDKKGGFIYQLDGMEMDCSVEAVTALLRENIETDVADILFSGKLGE